MLKRFDNLDLWMTPLPSGPILYFISFLKVDLKDFAIFLEPDTDKIGVVQKYVIL